jgi:hypothetical protein
VIPLEKACLIKDIATSSGTEALYTPVNPMQPYPSLETWKQQRCKISNEQGNHIWFLNSMKDKGYLLLGLDFQAWLEEYEY